MNISCSLARGGGVAAVARVLLPLLALLAGLAPAWGAGLSLAPPPGTFLAEEPGQEMPSTAAGATAFAMGNIGPLADAQRKTRPAFTVQDARAFAMVTAGGWMRTRHGRWTVAWGTGLANTYEGNRDAGQLWVDLHLKEPPTDRTYAPVGQCALLNATWLGVGRKVSLARVRHGASAELMLRGLSADALSAYTAEGTVQGEAFAGMVRRLNSAPPGGARARGAGWAVDARLTVPLTPRWTAYAAAEGLAGELAWRDIAVDDEYLTSPGVFQDPQGFLRDCGGMSGANWRERLTAPLVPRYRIDLVGGGDPGLLFGVRCDDGARLFPVVGVNHYRRDGLNSYLRVQPLSQVVELGVAGRGWSLGLAGDAWLVGSPSRAQVTFAAALPIF